MANLPTVSCPDGGRCHHKCGEHNEGKCFRVQYCAPFANYGDWSPGDKVTHYAPGQASDEAAKLTQEAKEGLYQLATAYWVMAGIAAAEGDQEKFKAHNAQGDKLSDFAHALGPAKS